MALGRGPSTLTTEDQSERALLRRRDRRDHGAVKLVLAAAVMVAVYAGFFLARYPLVPNFQIPLLDLGKLGGYDPATGAAVAAAWATLIAAHVVAWRAARGLSAGAVPALLAVSLALQFVLLMVYPIVAADLFNYLIQGRLAAVHGLNPLTAAPNDAAGDPWLAYSAYRDIRLAYGPTWVWPATLIATAAGDNLLAGLLAFKAVAVAANVANSLLIAGIVRRIKPSAVAPAVVAYAWCPLVLFETVANGHNDGIVATCVLLALWLIVRGGRMATLAPTALMVAALAKYTPLVLLPIVIGGSWRAIRAATTRRAAVTLTGAGAVLAVVLAVIAFVPYWAGLDTLAGVRQQASEATTSVAAIVLKSGLMTIPTEVWLTGARILATALVAALVVARWPRTPNDSPAAAYDVVLAQLFIATFWFQPWYVVPLVALGAAAISGWRASVALTFAASATASYIVYFYLWTTPWWGTLSDVQIQTLAVTVTFGPPLALLFHEGLKYNRRRASRVAPLPTSLP